MQIWIILYQCIPTLINMYLFSSLIKAIIKPLMEKNSAWYVHQIV